MSGLNMSSTVLNHLVVYNYPHLSTDGHTNLLKTLNEIFAIGATSRGHREPSPQK